jgi:hypothetical protein
MIFSGVQTIAVTLGPNFAEGPTVRGGGATAARASATAVPVNV